MHMKWLLMLSVEQHTKTELDPKFFHWKEWSMEETT